jgi:hypothetical protein
MLIIFLTGDSDILILDPYHNLRIIKAFKFEKNPVTKLPLSQLPPHNSLFAVSLNGRPKFTSGELRIP